MLLAERGVVASYETIRRWCKKFGQTVCATGRVRQQITKVSLAEHEALASDRTDQPLNVTVLPRGTWRDRAVAPMVRRRRVTAAPYDASRSRIAGRLIPWECLGNLPGDPLRRWVCRHIGPDEPSPLQMKDDQSVQKLEPERRNDEQIDGRDVGSMTAQEGPPARRRRAAAPGSTGRCRYRVSAARHGCEAHPRAGCRG